MNNIKMLPSLLMFAEVAKQQSFTFAAKQLCIDFPLIESKLVVTDESRNLIQDKLGVALYTGELSKQRWISAPWQSETLAMYKSTTLADKIELDVHFCAHTNTLPTVLQTALASGRLVRVLPSHQGRQWPVFIS